MVCEPTWESDVPKPVDGAMVTMLGLDAPLQWNYSDGKLRISVPPLSVKDVPCQHAYVFKMTT